MEALRAVISLKRTLRNTTSTIEIKALNLSYFRFPFSGLLLPEAPYPLKATHLLQVPLIVFLDGVDSGWSRWLIVIPPSSLSPHPPLSSFFYVPPPTTTTRKTLLVIPFPLNDSFPPYLPASPQLPLFLRPTLPQLKIPPQNPQPPPPLTSPQ